jgi:tetratricopeptide (TPR) repeat protein
MSCASYTILKKLFILTLICHQYSFAAVIRDGKQCSLAAEHLKTLQSKRGKGVDSDELIDETQNLRYFSNGNNCKRNEAACMELIGSLHFDKGLLRDAIKYHLIAHQEFSRLSATKDVARINNKLGISYNFIGNQTMALKHLLQAEDALISLKLSNSIQIADVYTNISTVYEEQNQNSNVKKYLFKALKIYKRHGVQSSIADVYNNYGKFYMDKQNDIKKAKEYFIKSYQIQSKLKTSISAAITAYNLGYIYSFEKTKVDKAIFYFQITKKISSELGNDYYFGMALQALGDIYRKTKNYPKSEKMLLEASKLQKRSGSLPELSNCYMSLSILYEEMGNFKDALYFSSVSFNLKDSIINEDKTREFIALQKQFESFKGDKKIQLLERDKEIAELRVARQQNYTIFSIILFIILIYSFYFYFRAVNNRNRLTLEKRIAVAAISALNAQINSHFIANTLVSVKLFLNRKDTEKSIGIIDNFSLLMRNTLIYSREDRVSLDEDVENLKTYLAIEKVNHSDKFNYEIKLDNDISPETIQIPPMLVQPFIENAIKHGIHTKKEGKISISYSIDTSSKLCIRITDNGNGIELIKSLPSKIGEGTKIILERLAIFNSDRSDTAALSFSNASDGGTVVTILIPIQ